MINAGKKEIYRFEINSEKDLVYVDSNGEKHLESGDFYIIIGNEKIKFDLVD